MTSARLACSRVLVKTRVLVGSQSRGLIKPGLGHCYCVRSTRTQPLICVRCSMHYWVTCAINKGGVFEIVFSFVVVDTHLPRFEVLA